MDKQENKKISYLNKRKILIKIGSGIISKDSKLDKEFLKKKVTELAGLIKAGKRIILVSSGAVAMGMEIEGLTVRPKNLFKLQLLSGKGQPKLMSAYIDYFKEYNIQVGQVLLTHYNFKNPLEIANVRSIMDGYLSHGDLPIINENDAITNEEFTRTKQYLFSDNDELATIIATNLSVDLLLILTDVDGLYNKNPNKNTDAKLIRRVYSVTPDIENMAKKGISEIGMGGMLSKVLSAKKAMENGITTIITNGKYDLRDILENKVNCTIFDKTD